MIAELTSTESELDATASGTHGHGAPPLPTGRERHRARGALVVSQVALALVLLVSTGLMIRSFQALGDVQPGFVEPDDVLSFKISIPETEIADLEQTVRTQEQILRRL